MTRGPVPKHPDQRRRSNKPVHDWVVLDHVYDGPIPPLEGDQWTAGSLKWWETIWRTPMATQWNDGDVPGLEELAALRQMLVGGQATLANEVRLRSDGFGLTPAGRQKLRWIITDADAQRAGLLVDTDEVAKRRKERRSRGLG